MGLIKLTYKEQREDGLAESIEELRNNAVLPKKFVSLSPGVLKKPDGCKRCAYSNVGHGFCPDWYPPNPKLAILLEAPGQDEIINASPLMGTTGKFFFAEFLEPLGLTRYDVLIANTIRCRPPNNQYPDGPVRGHAEELCRQYDRFHGAENGDLLPGGLVDWNPNAFVCTIHPASLLRTTAKYRILKRGLDKAIGLVYSGYRPLVVLGDKALKLVAPWTGGSLKHFDGHIWFGELPFRGNRT